MRSVYAEAKLAVEGANLDADIKNRRLLQEYRAELMKWRKKRAAVHRMQLNLPDTLMEQIIKLMKKHSTTLENELELCQAAGMPNDALQAHTDRWEAEMDELVDALFLQSIMSWHVNCRTSVGKSRLQ